MVEISSGYMECLNANFPDAAGKLKDLMSQNPSGDTPEAKAKAMEEIELKIKTIANEHQHFYEIWEKVPEALRIRYAGRVPQDVMDAAARDEILTLREMEYHPEIKRAEDARAAVREKYGVPAEIVNDTAAMVFLAAVAAGYSEHASTRLALQRQHRDGLLNEKAAILADQNLSDAEKKEKLKDWLENKWFKSKEESIKTIKEDRIKNQPEKHLIHLLAQYSRKMFKLDKSLKAGKIDQKTYEEMSENYKKELMPQVADMVQKIETNGRQDKLLEHLKRHPALIRHLRDEARDILANSVLKDVPEAEKEKYLARSPRHKRGLKENTPEEKKAEAVAKDISASRANALPEQRTLTAEERRANMPTMLNRTRGERQL